MSSASVLFVDVIGAFDAVVGDLLFDSSLLDEQVAAALRACGFGPEVMHELAEQIRGESIAKQAGLHPHLQAILQQAHASTWFSTQGVSAVVETKVGSRPGDPVGDVVYNFLATKVLQEVEKEAMSRGVVPMLPSVGGEHTLAQNAPLALAEVSYVDDSASL